jgi:hypothetical protein
VRTGVAMPIIPCVVELKELTHGADASGLVEGAIGITHGGRNGVEDEIRR